MIEIELIKDEPLTLKVYDSSANKNASFQIENKHDIREIIMMLNACFYQLFRGPVK